MIIGIDESGHFDDKEISVFISVFIRPSIKVSLDVKFNAWEQSLPDNVKIKGEVKGSLLTIEQLEYFIDNILISENINYSAFGIKLDANNLAGLQEQKKRIVKGTHEAVGYYRFRGSKFRESAKDYLAMYRWCRTLKLVNLAKITLLGFTITESLNNAIIVSAIGGFDKELGDLSYKIDNDFIPKEKEIFWKDLLRVQIYNNTVRNPIIEISEWDENHPFKKEFQENPASRKKKANLTQKFKDCISYHNSKDDIAIRIADITAVVVRRFVNGGANPRLYKKLKTMQVPKNSGSVVQLVLDQKTKKTKNPYNYSWVYFYRIVLLIKKVFNRGTKINN